VGALLGDAAVLEHDDAPGLADRREAVGDHDRGAPGEQAAQAGFDAALGVQVDVGGGLVEDQDARVGDQRAGERDQLALAGGELRAALADLGVVAVRQLGDELLGADRRGGGADLLVLGVGAAEGDVLAHGAREQERLLRHDPHLRAQRVAGDLAQVVPVDEHAPAGGVVEAGDELGHRRLARAGGAHERDVSPGRDVQVDVLEREWRSAGAPVRRCRCGSSLARRRCRLPLFGAAPWRRRAARARAVGEGDVLEATSPRIGPSAGASGASSRSGLTSSSWKIFSSAAMPDW
jgi:hypothetical protein